MHQVDDRGYLSVVKITHECISPPR
jgi:hypothetical protein